MSNSIVIIIFFPYPTTICAYITLGNIVIDFDNDLTGIDFKGTITHIDEQTGFGLIDSETIDKIKVGNNISYSDIIRSGYGIQIHKDEFKLFKKNIYEKILDKSVDNNLNCFSEKAKYMEFVEEYDTNITRARLADGEVGDDIFTPLTGEGGPDMYYFISPRNGIVQVEKKFPADAQPGKTNISSFKIHISVKAKYAIDALMKFLEYQQDPNVIEKDDCFHAFKFIFPRFRHIEYRNPETYNGFKWDTAGDTKELRDEEKKKTLESYFLNFGITAAANIVIYSNREYNSGNAFLRSFKHLIDFWQKVENETFTNPEGEDDSIKKGDKWKRDKNYLFFNFKVKGCKTLFVTGGSDTADRLTIYEDPNILKSKTPKFKYPVEWANEIYWSKILDHEYDTFCNNTPFSRDTKICLEDKYSLNETTLCNRKKPIQNIYSYTFYDPDGKSQTTRDGINRTDTFLMEHDLIDTCAPPLALSKHADGPLSWQYIKYLREGVWIDENTAPWKSNAGPVMALLPISKPYKSAGKRGQTKRKSNNRTRTKRRQGRTKRTKRKIKRKIKIKIRTRSRKAKSKSRAKKGGRKSRVKRH